MAKWCRGADKAYKELLAIKGKWDTDEWDREFMKRAGDYDHINKCIISNDKTLPDYN